MQNTPQVSIIIPIAPAETQWRNLLVCFVDLPWNSEILLIGATSAPDDFRNFTNDLGIQHAIRWVDSDPGRARQLNTGSKFATGRFLWFLHADSMLTPQAIEALDQALTHRPNTLHYFRLKFHDDGPRPMVLNAAGVWFRSHWLGMPFGDQGFCIEQSTFEKLGGFDETAPYGEDHLFVWTARQNGIRLNGIREPIRTSARKYQEHGWWRTTCRHVILTYRQAIPEFWQLMKKRVYNR